MNGALDQKGLQALHVSLFSFHLFPFSKSEFYAAAKAIAKGDLVEMLRAVFYVGCFPIVLCIV